MLNLGKGLANSKIIITFANVNDKQQIMTIKAKCIKETYTWVGDGEQHRFPYVKLGLVYVFNKEEQYKPHRNTVFWLDKTQLPNKQDYGYIDCCARGLEEKEFNEMFEIIK